MANTGNEAEAYWAAHPFDGYHADGRQRTLIVRTVLELQRRAGADGIRSIFEFGCNVGRNLERLRHVVPNLELAGTDINEGAVAEGRARYGLDLRVGNHTALKEFPDRRFDCSLTLSVLDHISDIDQVRETLIALGRITRRYLLILEPYNGRDERAPELRVRFNYYWNYPRLFREAGFSLLHDIPFPLSFETPIRSAYRLYVVGTAPNSVGLSLRFILWSRVERFRFRLAQTFRNKP
jgi:Methyltransferase domain